ncbi:BrnT family toxin [Nitrospira sp. BLG_2]|uniref:BrnT family toxin n=1 Tax=Nitrospira sp. BLG_2 TaxID=3397507 RepID=UPI003B99AEFA
MTYEWNPRKAEANRRKHGVSFEEAASVFQDADALTFQDPDHSDEEPREITIGISTQGRVLFLSHCDRGERIRIISARKATPKERKQYAEDFL